MTVIADLHTHTLASDHAYSTLVENIKAAKEAGLKALAITDHTPALRDAPLLAHFENLKALPKSFEGVRIIKGAETNIVDFDGEIDLPIKYLKRMEIVIASFHRDARNPSTIEDHTNAYKKVAENPYIDIIGHSGNPNFPYNYEEVIPLFAKMGKAVEINESSPTSRPNSEENCRKILSLCKKHEVYICINSDAHFCSAIGHYDNSLEMVREIKFPEELIINTDLNRLNKYLQKRKEYKESI